MRLLSSSALMLALAAAPALAQPTLSGDGDTITIVFDSDTNQPNATGPTRPHPITTIVSGI